VSSPESERTVADRPRLPWRALVSLAHLHRQDLLERTSKEHSSFYRSTSVAYELLHRPRPRSPSSQSPAHLISLRHPRVYTRVFLYDAAQSGFKQGAGRAERLPDSVQCLPRTEPVSLQPPSLSLPPSWSPAREFSACGTDILVVFMQLHPHVEAVARCGMQSLHATLHRESISSSYSRFMCAPGY
jgi:hypothetical protein